jgi:FkbM family methyltransferase
MLSPEEKKAVIDLFPFLRDSPTIIDCGSNKGGWSDVVLDEFGDRCMLHLFEPVDILLNFTRVKYEYRKNVVYNGLMAYNKTGESKPFFFFENFNNELSSAYKAEKEWDRLPMKEKRVHTITIDEYCQKSHIEEVDYIKIDCEASDVDVLEGCRKLMSDDNVRIIQIEYSEHYKRANRSFQDIVNICQATSYKIYRYIENNFWEVKEDNPPFDNYFLTKYEIHNYCIGGSNANFIINTADLPKVDLILEVGAMEGITTKYMCQNMLNADNPDARIIVVDPLMDYYVTDDPRYHQEFRHQYQRFKRNTRGLPVELKRGKSQDELPKLHAMRFSFIYLDGDHYSPMPYLDAVWCFAILKIGGHLLVDDYLWCEETKESIDKFLNEFKGHYDIVRQGYQILIQKTSNHYTDLTFEFYK